MLAFGRKLIYVVEIEIGTLAIDTSVARSCVL